MTVFWLVPSPEIDLKWRLISGPVFEIGMSDIIMASIGRFCVSLRFRKERRPFSEPNPSIISKTLLKVSL